MILNGSSIHKIFNESTVMYEDCIEINENGEPLNESSISDALLVFTPIAVITVAAIAAIKWTKKTDKKLKAAIKHYEELNPDLIKLSDMNYRLYKIKSGLFKKATTDSKGKEDIKDLGILEKLFKKKRDARANRICEYLYDGKPAIAVLYEHYETQNTSYINVSISFSSQKFLEHKDYYSNVICLDRDMYAKDYKKFIEKYYVESEEE